MNEGWISLHRKISLNWIWEDKPFSKGQAWIDLLLMANHKNRKIPFDNGIIEIKRGSFVTSIRKLSEKWGWSRTKVSKFLQYLNIDNMVTLNSDIKKTAITIVNYDCYTYFFS